MAPWFGIGIGLTTPLLLADLLDKPTIQGGVGYNAYASAMVGAMPAPGVSATERQVGDTTAIDA